MRFEDPSTNQAIVLCTSRRSSGPFASTNQEIVLGTSHRCTFFSENDSVRTMLSPSHYVVQPQGSESARPYHDITYRSMLDFRQVCQSG